MKLSSPRKFSHSAEFTRPMNNEITKSNLMGSYTLRLTPCVTSHKTVPYKLHSPSPLECYLLLILKFPYSVCVFMCTFMRRPKGQARCLPREVFYLFVFMSFLRQHLSLNPELARLSYFSIAVIKIPWPRQLTERRVLGGHTVPEKQKPLAS